MKQFWWALAALVAITTLSAAWLHDHDSQVTKRAVAEGQLRQQKQITSKWKARYAEAASHVAHDIDTVTVTVTSYRDLRGSLPERITDTVYVKQLVAAADAAASACTELAKNCAQLKHDADSTIASVEGERDALQLLYNATKPRFRDRFSLSACYVPFTDPRSHLGPGACFRVFP
jgi:hypothetical protein